MKRKQISYRKNIIIYLPEQLVSRLDSILNDNPPDFKYDITVFYGILEDILCNRSMNKSLENSNMQFVSHVENIEEDIGTPMSSKYMERKYGKVYVSHMYYLQDNNLIELVKEYEVIDRKCRRYIIPNQKLVNNLYMESNLHHENISDNRMIAVEISYKSNLGKAIIQRHEKRTKKAEGYPKHIKEMRNHYNKQFKLDTVGAIRWVESNIVQLRKKCSYLSAIYRIKGGTKNKQLYYERNDTNNRIDTNLTNLSKDLRPFIISQEPLINIDIRNSQPLFFNLILNELVKQIYNKYPKLNSKYKFNPYSLSPLLQLNIAEHIDVTMIKVRRKDQEKFIEEVKKYHNLTVKGLWYEYLGKIFGITRESAKGKWMAIAYCSNKSVKYYFDKVLFQIYGFPIISEVIRQIKVKDHSTFAVSLQRIESAIFIDNICKKLVDEEIIPFTIHDSVIVKESQVQRAKEIMEEVLKSCFGKTPIIKTERVDNAGSHKNKLDIPIEKIRELAIKASQTDEFDVDGVSMELKPNYRYLNSKMNEKKNSKQKIK